MVFGIPYGKKDIHGSDGNINEDSISARNKKLGMDLASSHSLCTAEDFLKRNITEESSKLEKDCFQIAFMLFVTGHVISQSCKCGYKSIHFCGALASREDIARFNRCMNTGLAHHDVLMPN
uniref:Uncharacterized protein n=1 Tax=Aegilops tauschii TaxID=37682 RepID=M8B3V0_AEGTA